MSSWILPVQDHPLFGILLTLLTYMIANHAWHHLGKPALLHPVLVATSLLALILIATGITYGAYFEQALLLNEALAVVVVLLAVPLVRQMPLIIEAGRPIVVTLVLGSVAALVTALALPAATGADHQFLATLAPKSATAAVAVQVAVASGGIAAVTAVIVISTGIFGAVFGPAILAAAGVKDHRAKGFALGIASHAIGTARAFQMSDVAGAFASLGMILNALLTIALVPLIMALMAT